MLLLFTSCRNKATLGTSQKDAEQVEHLGMENQEKVVNRLQHKYSSTTLYHINMSRKLRMHYTSAATSFQMLFTQLFILPKKSSSHDDECSLLLIQLPLLHPELNLHCTQSLISSTSGMSTSLSILEDFHYEHKHGATGRSALAMLNSACNRPSSSLSLHALRQCGISNINYQSQVSTHLLI